MTIRNLHIDIETYSDIDLSKCGVYKYAESPNFDILTFGVSVNDEPIKVYDLVSGEKLPKDIIEAITDDKVMKIAHNAVFERVCLSIWIKINYPQYFKSYNIESDTGHQYLNPQSWRCTMVMAAYCTLPSSLKEIGKILKLKNQKLEEGKSLIDYFCKPCRPTSSNGGRRRNLPEHATDKWETFKKYNCRDVEVEMAVYEKLSKFSIPEFIWEEYCLDQMINDRGVKLDMNLVEQAILFDSLNTKEVTSKLKDLTALENPNSVQQMKNWLFDNGINVESLDKNAVETAISTTSSKKVIQVLKLYQQLKKSSVKKYEAMKSTACSDNRSRGLFQFYGASRTGRWAGRYAQLQNLPRNYIQNLEEIRELVKSGEYEKLKIEDKPISSILSELIRTALVPNDNFKFIVADFSSIEARVLSKIANETWRLKVFDNNEDIYCASASQMFGVPVEKHGQNAHLRQKGKIAELALGYGGSVGALKAMGALDMGINEEELPILVNSWRFANPNIVNLWWDIDKAAKNTITQQLDNEVNSIKFKFRSGILFIILPSGRHLCYLNPRVEIGNFGKESITYSGINSETKKWDRIETYGAKLTENIVQAISRDILAYAMLNLKDYNIVAHIHDEVVIECSKDMSVDSICQQMSITPPWIEGLNLRAEGFESMFYKKD